MNFLPRNLRSMELYWLLIALIISVASLTSVSYLADRMQRAFDRDAKQLIAADYLIRSDQPLPPIFREKALTAGLSIAQTVTFPTMSGFSGQSKLISLKAVSDGYPLRGSIKVATRLPIENGFAVNDIPAPGTIWVDQALLPALGTALGDVISVGQSKLKITGVITQELDKGAGFLNFSPRVMMRLDELDKTQLVGFGSRVTYRLLLAGDEKAVASYIQWVQKNIDSLQLRGVSVEGVDNSQPLMRSTLDRAEKFLSLVALLTAMVSAVSMALAARRYVAQQSSVAAIWKCLGASKKQILWAYLKTILWVGLFGSLLGAFLGWLSHEVLLFFLNDLLIENLPLPSIWPIMWSVLVSLVLLLGFVWPPMMALSGISPLRVLRKDVPLPNISAWLLSFIGLLSFLILLMVIARDLKLAAMTLGGFIGACGIFFLASWVVVKLSAWMATHSLLGRDVIQRFTWQSLSRRALLSSIQISSLAIALMALLLLALVRQDLIAAWQLSSTVEAPNRFLINIQPDQKNAVELALHQAGVKDVSLFPMVRGRLTHINHQIVLPQNYQDERAKRLIDREFNLSYGSILPPKNKVIEGRWHANTDDAEISIEQGLATNLGLKLNDVLQFDISGENISAKITSIRKLYWGSLRVNFFAILPSKMLAEMPQTWITAYQQAGQNEANIPVDMALVSRFPNITVVDVASSLRQVQDVLDKLTAAVELLFMFTISAGVLVLAVALSSTQEERLKDATLLKVMGASGSQIRQSFYTELGVIGFVSGALAACGALIIGWCLAHFIFEIDLAFSWWVIVDGVCGGVIICILAGMGMQRKIAYTSASDVLREM